MTFFLKYLPFTTKGDICTNNGTENVRLPVGTNDQVLTCDSSTDEGIKWSSPIFLSIGHTSAVSTGNPAFTSPIAITYSALEEGTWTKIVGLSQLNIQGNISYSSNTVTIGETGKYSISISSCYAVDSGSRISLFSIGINQTDSDKPLGSLTPNGTASQSSAGEFQNVSSTDIFSLSAGDTVKFFYSQLNEGGTTVNNVNIAIARINIRKI